jgi:NADPH-dependent 2,4-dienoyl-CoA reductase/sulfur reductase-like enzyme
MNRITEAARTVDVVHETDVLVVGSGPGGLSAALAAARGG